jgi:AcrR family transcriptional regulator
MKRTRPRVVEPPLRAPFEDRRRARDAKKLAVLRTAAQLFIEVGYHRATLTDVAAHLNITKPALYNYFRSKEEILDECYRLGQELVEASIAEIERAGGDGLTKLRKLIRAYALVMTVDFGMCQVRLDDRELSDEARARVREAKRKDDRAFRTYIREGVSDGSILPCDPKLSAFAIAGSLNWIGHWYRPDGKLSAEAIAEEFAIRLTDGLAARRAPGRSARTAVVKGETRTSTTIR